jgi:exopolysaccharide biosynthesis polyprenyl glycosylphosphotransferase
MTTTERPGPVVPLHGSRRRGGAGAELLTVDVLDDAQQRGWRRKLASYLAVTDVVVIIWAALGAHFVRSGIQVSGRAVSPVDPAYVASTIAVALLWILVLSVFDTRDSKIVGFGALEYKRVLNATFVTFGLVALTSYAFQLNLSRSYVLVMMPAGTATLIAGRWVWRRWLHQQRDAGRFSNEVLAVGNPETVRELITELHRSPRAGYRVVAACVSGGVAEVQATTGSDRILGVPVVGSLDQVVAAVRLTGIDTVAVTSTGAFGATAVRKLSWDLEKTDIDLILAPALTDIAGPRVHTLPVAGLPLLHVERPTYSGPNRIFKTAFDMVGATLLLMIAAPVILASALAIKIDSRGPVFFRQVRVGVDGKHFKMLKLRSMRIDAEAQLEQLLKLQRDAGNDVLFKMKDDPRVTRVGRFLRRYSLDELPQLFNVVRGEMSLVGPRPPLMAEVDLYEDEVHRRLLVKPGLTGLWQVSGRSDLSWDEAVRLDLSYVENWSITGDLVILFKTLKAVSSSSGAY